MHCSPLKRHDLAQGSTGPSSILLTVSSALNNWILRGEPATESVCFNLLVLFQYFSTGKKFACYGLAGVQTHNLR